VGVNLGLGGPEVALVSVVGHDLDSGHIYPYCGLVADIFRKDLHGGFFVVLAQSLVLAMSQLLIINSAICRSISNLNAESK
jgi:hypothetical protein